MSFSPVSSQVYLRDPDVHDFLPVSLRLLQCNYSVPSSCRSWILVHKSLLPLFTVQFCSTVTGTRVSKCPVEVRVHRLLLSTDFIPTTVVLSLRVGFRSSRPLLGVTYSTSSPSTVTVSLGRLLCIGAQSLLLSRCRYPGISCSV